MKITAAILNSSTPDTPDEPKNKTASSAGAAQPGRKSRGRPLSFDREAALESAMRVFWDRGYESTSIADLTLAMGITPPSLYTAFGDKEHLFFEAVERYTLTYGNINTQQLQENPSARNAIEQWLTNTARELTQPCHPKGCMLVTAATNCSAAAQHVQAALARRRAQTTAAICARIERGINEGELPPDSVADELGNFYATVSQGMSMQAKDGASHETLAKTVQLAMRAWPMTNKRHMSTATNSSF